MDKSTHGSEPIRTEQTGGNTMTLTNAKQPKQKMIPVEELDKLLINRDVWMDSFDDHKKGMNALFDKLQEKINKYK